MSFEPMNCARELKWRLCSGSDRGRGVRVRTKQAGSNSEIERCDEAHVTKYRHVVISRRRFPFWDSFLAVQAARIILYINKLMEFWRSKSDWSNPCSCDV